MKISNTSRRLKEIMASQNLRQVDILDKAKTYADLYDIRLNKNDLSQYVSGKVEPGQEKLFLLSKALQVDIAWLMGYDVQMKTSEHTDSPKIMEYYNSLNDIGRHEATKRVEELTYVQKYITDIFQPNAAHERTDIDVTSEMRRHDDDIMDENF